MDIKEDISMNGNLNHIRIAQGMSTKVYRFYAGSHCIKVDVRHHEVKPIIFRSNPFKKVGIINE